MALCDKAVEFGSCGKLIPYEFRERVKYISETSVNDQRYYENILAEYLNSHNRRDCE